MMYTVFRREAMLLSGVSDTPPGVLCPTRTPPIYPKIKTNTKTPYIF